MKRQIAYTGFFSAAAAALAAMAFSIVQILQVVGLISRPLDEILIYSFSLCIAPPFLVAVLALHYSVPKDRRFWSHLALLFGLMYTVYVVLMYSVQLATVIPFSPPNSINSLLAVTPHSFFWTLDALGYICMGLSTLSAAFVFTSYGPQRRLRLFLMLNGFMIPFISFAYFYPYFSTWVLFIGAPWIITAPGSLILLAVYFQTKLRETHLEENYDKLYNHEQKSISDF
jgi:hypothetical protein